MEDDMKQLKSVLRALAVSSPVQLTLGALLRDYRSTMGAQLPVHKYGYRDALQFLKDRCGDCFLGSGPNTVLIPIVPDSVKHIDNFVQKQKVNPKMKFKGKRTSVPESILQPAPNLIAESFELALKHKTESVRPICKTSFQTKSLSKRDTEPAAKSRAIVKNEPQAKCELEYEPVAQPQQGSSLTSIDKWKSTSTLSSEDKENQRHESGITSMEAYKNFLRRRLPVYESTHDLDSLSLKDSDSGKCTSESDPQTSSTTSSDKQSQLEELKAEVTQLVLASPDGVLCTDLMRLYRCRYGRELDFSRFGYTCVSSLAWSLSGVRALREAAGTRLLSASAPPPAASPARRARPRSVAAAASAAARAPSPEEDALPWIDYDPDVFPADCLSFSESIPALSLEDIEPGDMVEVMVGEVYSPSHFWVYRLGDEYNIAMEDIMDEMTEYYTKGEGAGRSLAVGAVRVGHYCSSVYERDWHRSLIVKVEDSDTVKVRHVDYGTVERVASTSLKPLLRRWALLPAQGLRSRLAGVRPAAAGRRWPHAASAAFLRLVQDRKLVGNVVAVDRAENILELFLVDTSTETDIRVDLELIRGGHAEPRAAPPAHALAESWLYPRFGALEAGATPNFGDISAYLRDGIALDFVQEYRDHVPASLPPPPPPPSPPPPPPPRPRRLDNRVPLLPLRAPEPAPETPSPPLGPVMEPEGELEPKPKPEPVVEPEKKPVQRAVSVESVPTRRHLVPAARVQPHTMAAVSPPRPPPPPLVQPMPFFVFPPQPPPPLYPCPYRGPPAPLRPYPSMQLYPAPAACFYQAARAPPAAAAPPVAAAPPATAAPPAPAAGRRITTGAGEVSLSVSECEIFTLLCSVDSNAAHWYIVDAISRARLRSGTAAQPPGAMPDTRLNPLASEFRLASTTTQTEPSLRPPPGFDLN